MWGAFIIDVNNSVQNGVYMFVQWNWIVSMIKNANW